MSSIVGDFANVIRSAFRLVHNGPSGGSADPFGEGHDDPYGPRT
jgi:hypothetical protein